MLNPNIILAGQSPDIMGSLSRGMATGQQANQIQQQNALANLYQTQGAGIAAGDPTALNALAGIDPMAALGVQGERLGMDATRLGMDATRQSMTVQAETAKRQAAEYAAGLSAEQRLAEAAQLEQGLKGAAFFHAQGDRAGYERFLAQQGIDPAQFDFDQFPAHAAMMGGVLEVLKGFTPEAPTTGDNQTERDIALLAEIGIPRADAIRVTQLYTVARDPVTGEQTLIDKSTGRPVNNPPAMPAAPAVTPGQQPAAPATEAAPLSFGAQYPDATNAFGVEGFARRMVNTASDVAGMAAPFPETAQTQADFSVLQERLLNDIASSYGRQPPSWLLQNIRDLTPTPGTPFQGAGGAQSKLEALGRDLTNELANIESQMQGRMAPADRQTLMERRAGINAALGRIRSAVGSFSAGVEIRPEVADRLRAYE